MEELKTIQKRSKLNRVGVLDAKGNGGAHHRYVIKYDTKDTPSDSYVKHTILEFQNGPRHQEDSESGVLDVDLLEIVRHRLQCFQQGGFATRENAIALTHIEEALLWLNKRVEDRAERNVLGTNEK